MQCYFPDLIFKRPLEAGGLWYRNCYTNLFFNLRFPMPEGFHLMEAWEKGPVLNHIIKEYPVEERAALATDYTEAFSMEGPSKKAAFFASVQEEPKAVLFSELFYPEEYEKAERPPIQKLMLGDVEFTLERVFFSGEKGGGQFHFYCGIVGKHSFNLFCFLEEGEEAGKEYDRVLNQFDRAIYVTPPVGETEPSPEKMKEALQKEYRNIWMASKLHLEPDNDWKEPVPPKTEQDFIAYTK